MMAMRVLPADDLRVRASWLAVVTGCGLVADMVLARCHSQQEIGKLLVVVGGGWLVVDRR
jgi:hypothetical protein